MSNGGVPTPPGQVSTHGRDRSKSTFSLKSGSSHKSNGSAGKIQYSESHQEKESKRLHTKADPSMAINEEQPFALASATASNLQNLRALQHKDAHGNIIAEPDRSNPTRSRWERPLDTIRAFEAAIDGNYKRQSYARTDTDSIAPGGRRSSYYAGSTAGVQTPGRPPQDSYYGGGGRQSVYSQQPDYRGNGNGNGYFEGGPSNGYTPNRARYPRTGADQQGNGQGPYPNAYGNQQSYETVTTASGSGSEPLGYSTDPSSENSSIDRLQAASNNKADFPPNGGEYGSYNNGNYGYSSGYPSPDGPYQGRGGGGQGPPPPPPHKENAAQATPRVPIKLGGSPSGDQPTVYEPPRPEPTKRKSSFFKRFSKN